MTKEKLMEMGLAKKSGVGVLFLPEISEYPHRELGPFRMSCKCLICRHAVTVLFEPSKRENSPDFRGIFGVASFKMYKHGGR